MSIAATDGKGKDSAWMAIGLPSLKTKAHKTLPRRLSGCCSSNCSISSSVNPLRQHLLRRSPKLNLGDVSSATNRHTNSSQKTCQALSRQPSSAIIRIPRKSRLQASSRLASGILADSSLTMSPSKVNLVWERLVLTKSSQPMHSEIPGLLTHAHA
jgi:hypothetical protein